MSDATLRVVRAAVAYRTAEERAVRSPPPPQYWHELCAALDALTVANACPAPVPRPAVVWGVPPGAGEADTPGVPSGDGG